jgi:hypothetical protein
LSAGKPVKETDKLIAEREAALYDPDSRFRDHAAEVAASRAHAPDVAAADQAEADMGPSIYAKGERRRAGAGLTKEMIKRMADRAEETSAKRRSE